MLGAKDKLRYCQNQYNIVKFKNKKKKDTVSLSPVDKIKSVQLTRGKEKWIQCHERYLNIIEEGKLI